MHFVQVKYSWTTFKKSIEVDPIHKPNTKTEKNVRSLYRLIFLKAFSILKVIHQGIKQTKKNKLKTQTVRSVNGEIDSDIK